MIGCDKMTCGKDYMLSPENLALFGALDDAYNAYVQIQELHEQVCSENIRQNSGHFTLSRDKIHYICLSRYKKILNVFYSKHFRIFSEQFYFKFVNTDGLEYVRFCEYVKSKDPKKGFYRLKDISFKSFLFCLEKIAVTQIANKLMKNDFLPIWDNVDSWIRYCAATTWIQRRVDFENEADVPSAPDLIVFKTLNTVSCRLNNHEVIPEICLIPMIKNKKRAIKVPAHKCKTCGRLFIGEITYKIYNNEYGFLFFRKRSDDTEGNTFLRFAEESKLHSYGYNVIDGELSEKQRRDIIIRVLESGEMTYLEICRDIENAISIFNYNKNFILAITKWKSDLEFLGNYILDNPKQ